MRLCEAAFGDLWTYDGESFHAVAMHGVPAAFAECHAPARPRRLARHGVPRGCSRASAIVQIVDDLIGRAHTGRATRSHARWSSSVVPRSVLRVPLRKDDAMLGIHH